MASVRPLLIAAGVLCLAQSFIAFSGVTLPFLVPADPVCSSSAAAERGPPPASRRPRRSAVVALGIGAWFALRTDRDGVLGRASRGRTARWSTRRSRSPIRSPWVSTTSPRAATAASITPRAWPSPRSWPSARSRSPRCRPGTPTRRRPPSVGGTAWPGRPTRCHAVQRDARSSLGPVVAVVGRGPRVHSRFRRGRPDRPRHDGRRGRGALGLGHRRRRVGVRGRRAASMDVGRRRQPVAPARWLNVTTGFDDSTVALRRPPAGHRGRRRRCLRPDASTTKQPSLRARRRYPAELRVQVAGSLRTTSRPTPLRHGVPADVGARGRMTDARSSRPSPPRSTPSGRIVLVEHLRDLPNRLAFGPGAIHFQARARRGSAAAADAGSHADGRARLTPYVRGFVFERARP